MTKTYPANTDHIRIVLADDEDERIFVSAYGNGQLAVIRIDKADPKRSDGVTLHPHETANALRALAAVGLVAD
jgi:hypothetical protein